MKKPLHKSCDNKMIFGVCAGLAESFGIDPTLVRLGCAALALLSFGTAAVAYIVAAIILPEGEKAAAAAEAPRAEERTV